jgi:hypothetical protein
MCELLVLLFYYFALKDDTWEFHCLSYFNRNKILKYFYSQQICISLCLVNFYIGQASPFVQTEGVRLIGSVAEILAEGRPWNSKIMSFSKTENEYSGNKYGMYSTEYKLFPPFTGPCTVIPFGYVCLLNLLLLKKKWLVGGFGQY